MTINKIKEDVNLAVVVGLIQDSGFILVIKNRFERQGELLSEEHFYDLYCNDDTEVVTRDNIIYVYLLK